jgi:hypothetical protein
VSQDVAYNNHVGFRGVPLFSRARPLRLLQKQSRLGNQRRQLLEQIFGTETAEWITSAIRHHTAATANVAGDREIFLSDGRRKTILDVFFNRDAGRP